MGEKRSTYKILTGKLEGERQLGRPRGRWNVKEIGDEGVV